MKITAFLGSPRKNGVTSTIADRFLETAGQKGADITRYFLNDMDFKGCQGCHVCKTKKDYCILKDDLTPALEDFQNADLAVFATPVYFWDVTGQFKSFFDRTWSLIKPDYTTNPDPARMEKGKAAVWISSQGDEESKHRDVTERYSMFLSLFGCKTNVIRAFGMGNMPGDNVDLWLQQADELAEKLVK